MFNRLSKLLSPLGFLPLLLVWSGCQTPAEPAQSTLSGTVVYLERILLPPTATITVTLEDVSRLDVAATVLAEQVLSAKSAPPFAFELSYDPALIEPRGRYALRARIENDGRLLFTNQSHVPAFGDDPAVEILVSAVEHRSSRLPASMPDASLTNTYWKAICLGDVPVKVLPGKREVHFVLQTDGLARGHSGCNTFSGGFTTEEHKLSFGHLASTRMACLDGMEQEHRFLTALGATRRFSIQGDTLSLLDENNEVLLYGEAVYLP